MVPPIGFFVLIFLFYQIPCLFSTTPGTQLPDEPILKTENQLMMKCLLLGKRLANKEFVEVFVVMRNIGIHERTNELICQLTHVWEHSVKATHLFLSEAEIAEIKPYLPMALWEIPHLIVAENESGAPIGFMGIENRKLEMLFISPEFRGKGIGKEFIRHGIETFSINEVTVNEQNPQAIGFYEHMGFMVYKRTDLDEQGRPYPLLYMKR